MQQLRAFNCMLLASVLLAWAPVQSARAHCPMNQQPSMTAKISDPTVKAAIEALNAHDRTAWDALFAPGATFSDDGNEGSLKHFADGAFGKGNEGFTSISKVEENGRHVYGGYHSGTWGDFLVFFKFQLKDGRITRLEVGQAH